MLRNFRNWRNFEETSVSSEKLWKNLVSFKLEEIKNLWRRKCVRRVIFRNLEVMVEGGFALFNPYFVCNTSNCVTVRPVKGHLTQKMNIAFFIWNWCWIFFYSTIFSKKAVFSEKTAKNCFGGAFDNFLGKEGILRQKLT